MGLTIDKYGVIGQEQRDGTIDGGDSVNWQGHRMYLEDKPPMKLKDYIEFYRGKQLGYSRHPHSATTARYYKNPWSGNISRDQFTGILAALIKNTNRSETLKIMLHHAAWLFMFSYNTVRNGDETLKWKWPDLTFLDMWAMELRCFGKLSWLFWPVLNILDLHMLLNTIHFNIWSKDDDAISFAIKSIAQKEHIPTIPSIITWKILNKDKLLKFMKSYWCGWRKNCDMYDMYEKKIKELG